MNNKKLIIAALVVTISHFLLTSIIGHYINVQIGTQLGQVVVGGLTAAYDKNNDKDVTTINQNMKSQSDEIKD